MSAEIHVDRPPDGEGESRRRAVALAGDQRGAINREQLRCCGLTDDLIDFWIATGQLHPRHRGVYSLGHRHLDRRGRYTAAVLFAGPGAVLSHRSAADLWDLRASEQTRIDVTATGNRRGDRLVLIHRDTLAGSDVTVRDGVAVTTPLRTLVDLAGCVNAKQIERAIRRAVYERLTSTTALADALATRAGRRGSARLRKALVNLGETPGLTRSELEDLFVTFVSRHRLPPPQLNVSLRVAGRWIEADCLWPESRLIVELDGRDAHDSHAAFEADRARDMALAVAGWRTGRVTSRRLRHDAAALAAELRELTQRDARLPSTRR